MNHQIAEVLWNRPVAPQVFSLGVAVSTGYDRAIAGQFVMIRPLDQTSPLLGRPFSIYSTIREERRIVGLELLIKIIGTGTQQLGTLKPGASAALLGPLGNGFKIQTELQRQFIVAGGIGVVPLVFLAQMQTAEGIPADRITAFIGGRNATDLLGVKRLRRMNITVHLSTDDGSEGQRGLVTTVVENHISAAPPDIIYTCGPWPMLAEMASIAERHQIPCHASVETMMGCGMGACLSCVVPTGKPSSPYRHACIEGPVMNTRSILF